MMMLHSSINAGSVTGQAISQPKTVSEDPQTLGIGSPLLTKREELTEGVKIVNV